MKRLDTALTLLLLATSIPSLAAAEQTGAKTSGALRSSETPGVSLTEVVVPGPLVTFEAYQSPSGERSLILLVEPADDSEGPRFIYELRMADAARLSDLPVVLPPGTDSLASVDLAGNGTAELLIGEHGRIFRLVGEGKLELALEGEGVDLKGRARSNLDGSTVAASELVLAAIGSAKRLNLDPEEGRLRETQSYGIPVKARMQGRWLRLSSPLVSALPSPDSPREFTYMVGPEPIGDRRLRTLILEAGSGPEGAVRELWSQLPSPETVEESQYALLDGEIVLLVTTIRADKVGIFEKEKLRVLRLSEDRSRSGATPILEVESRTRNWYSPGVGVFDVNRDGFDDVVLVQPKGLGGGKLVVEAFMGSGSGAFEGQTRRTNLEVESETWSYGQDTNQDGFPDLVLIEGETLLVFVGNREATGDLVVNEEPIWRVPIGTVNDRLQVLDVVGDERPEVVLIEREGTGFRLDESPEEDSSGAVSDTQEKPIRGRLSLVVFSSQTGG
ncbi:MAG: VCBS repeat-containing protein [Thermoanaerobaculia bacterium]